MDHALRLVGIGIGPGDPELVTCKAVRLLREADVVVVPAEAAGQDAPGRAELTVLAHLEDPGVLRRVEVAPDAPEGVEDAWPQAVPLVLEAFDGGARTVAFVTLGDPSIYSGFAHLAHAVTDAREVEVEVVPGVTAMQALAAASRTPLVEGTESLTLVPAMAGLATFTDALEHSDTVVAYKGGRYLAAMRGELSRRGRLADAVLGEKVSLPEEAITPLADLPSGGRTDRPTTVIVPAAREERGEAR